MKCGNLAIELVPDDIPLRTEGFWDDFYGFGFYPKMLESFYVFIRILSNGCDYFRSFPEKCEIVGDITSGSSVFSAKCWREKRHIEAIECIWNNLTLEGSDCPDNSIESHGPGNKYGHG